MVKVKAWRWNRPLRSVVFVFFEEIMGFIALSFSYSGAALVVIGLVEAPGWGLLTNSLKGLSLLHLGPQRIVKTVKRFLPYLRSKLANGREGSTAKAIKRDECHNPRMPLRWSVTFAFMNCYRISYPLKRISYMLLSWAFDRSPQGRG